mmetsp:Transcript_41204/g.95435  ORF Transcript_41204/g.95435 Transcript_41204/m.95435 type:complete len:111 (-) Transcript_41204:64-396(-)
MGHSEAEKALGMDAAGCAALAGSMRQLGDFCSFTMFCILLQKARAGNEVLLLPLDAATSPDLSVSPLLQFSNAVKRASSRAGSVKGEGKAIVKHTRPSLSVTPSADDLFA